MEDDELGAGDLRHLRRGVLLAEHERGGRAGQLLQEVADREAVDLIDDREVGQGAGGDGEPLGADARIQQREQLALLDELRRASRGQRPQVLGTGEHLLDELEQCSPDVVAQRRSGARSLGFRHAIFNVHEGDENGPAAASKVMVRSLLGSNDAFFAGLGGAGGSLYYEPYVQAGFRRLALFAPVPLLGEYLRVSALARYGRPFSGAAFHQVAPQSYMAQGSVGLGNYRHWADSTPWEIELAVTVDSGLFVDHQGDALEERFVSVAVRYSAFTFETWNDLINQKDYGPTFGARLTLDLLYMYDRWFH